MGEAGWLNLGAGLALMVLPLAGLVSVATADGLLAPVVVALLGRELLGRHSGNGRVARV